MLKLLMLAAVLMQFPMLHSQASVTPPSVFYPPPQEPIQNMDVKQLREFIESDSKDEVIAWFMQEMSHKTEEQIVSEFATTLTIGELEKLYTILIKSTEQEWTEGLALKIATLLDQKIKIELAPMCDYPRIISIAQTPETPEFWILLSDGSTWNVDPIHLGGSSPELQKIMINSLLGDYVVKTLITSQNESYPFLFEVLAFPKCKVSKGKMLVKEDPGISFFNKNVFHLGNGGFAK